MMSDNEIEHRGGCILATWLMIKKNRYTTRKQIADETGYHRRSVILATETLVAAGNVRKRTNLLRIKELLFEKVE